MKIKLASIVFITLLFLAACGTAPTEVKPAERGGIPQIKITPPSPLPEKPQYEPPPSAPTVVEMKIEAKQFTFLPNEIKVAKGSHVKLIITSTDVPHTFTLDAFGIDEELPVGQDVVIEFDASKTGTFIFNCKKPGHTDMKGKLVIT